MRFDCNQSIKDKCDSQRKKSAVLLVFSIILFLFVLIFLASGTLKTIDEDGIVIFIWLCLLASGITTITSSIAIAKFGKLSSNLEQSHVRIDGAFVSGFGASISREDGAPFSIKISSITSVQYNGVEDGYNLILNTVAGTYKCLSIANAPQAAQAINQAIADYKNKSQQTAAPTASDRKCLFCGAPMSNSQQFCGSCGRRQD